MAGARCLDAKVKYQATVVEGGKSDQQYVGLTETTWRKRCGRNKLNSDQRIYFSLADYVPKPKDKGREFKARWNKQDKFYTPPCMDEKTSIWKRLD